MLLDEGENFEGFIIGSGLVCIHALTFVLIYIWLSLHRVSWKSEVNVAALTVLTKEVRSLNPTFQADDIRGMVYNLATWHCIIAWLFCCPCRCCLHILQVIVTTTIGRKKGTDENSKQNSKKPRKNVLGE